MKDLNRFSKNKNYLCLLSNCKNKLRKAIVTNSTREQIYSICECILNVCNGNIKISKEEFLKLKKYKKDFQSINKQTHRHHRKEEGFGTTWWVFTVSDSFYYIRDFKHLICSHFQTIW